MFTGLKEISELNLNQVHTDFKAETVAAHLIKYYGAHANVFMKRAGINERPYRKDIKNIYQTYYGLDEETMVLETYREGIYDYLPEGLFHPLSSGSFNRGVDSMVKEIRNQKKVENKTRDFFEPFELEFFYTQISALLKEMEFDITDKSEVLISALTELWPLLQQVDRDTARTFLYILPFLHEVRGNKTWIERFLSAFLRVKVKIDFVSNVIDARDDTKGTTTLGNSILGISFIPNDKHMDGERNWLLNIGPIPSEKIHQYIPGHPFRDLLESIYNYFIPVSVKVFEKFVTEKHPESFSLSSSSEKEYDRLGYTTFA